MEPRKLPKGRVIIEYRVIFVGSINDDYISNHQLESDARQVALEHSRYTKDTVVVIERASNNGYSDNRHIATYDSGEQI